MNSPNLKDIIVDEHQPAHHKVLTIDLIKPYDGNPRRTINPRYHEIKASIRAKGGLNNLLTVTRRPGDIHYMVASGGNTRLMILKELWQELALECFYNVHCLVVPWLSDSVTLSGHLIENELRGEMTLIDKALALRDLKTQLENERGQSLSLREFSRQLKQMGYPASPRQLTRFNYAAEFLEPLIPIALAAGLGSASVERLRKMEFVYSKFIEGFGNSQSFATLFAQTLQDYDSERLDFDALQRILNNHIADHTGQSFKRVRKKVEALMFDAPKNSEYKFPTPSDLAIEPMPSTEQVDSVNTAAAPALPTSPDPAFKYQDTQQAPLGSFDPLSNPSPETSTGDSDNGMGHPSPFTTASATCKPLHLADLAPLRSRCCDLAQQISSSLPLPLAVKPWRHGYGFYLDLPEQPIQDEMVYFVFWLLLGLSEQHLSMERVKLAQEMKFAQLLLTHQERNAYAVVGSPAPLANLGHSALLTTKFPEQALLALFQLVQLSRQIRFSFRESDIFECITLEQIQLRDQMVDYQTTEGDNDE
jgi:ParB family protein of integrating conjugative element (PFGI_1 class)